MKDEVTILNDQVWDTFVKVCDLRNFSCFKYLYKVIDLGTDCVVVVRQFVWSELQFLGSACDDGVYSFVRFTERTKLVAKTRCPVSLFNFNLTGQGSEIVDVFGTFIFLDCK